MPILLMYFYHMSGKSADIGQTPIRIKLIENIDNLILLLPISEAKSLDQAIEISS